MLYLKSAIPHTHRLTNTFAFVARDLLICAQKRQQITAKRRRRRRRRCCCCVAALLKLCDLPLPNAAWPSTLIRCAAQVCNRGLSCVLL